MIFESISIENFCSVGSVTLGLKDQGLVVVTGRNNDLEGASSNGSGKSTVVVDSLCWVLFGKTTKGGPADSVTPGGKGKGTCVSLDFNKDGRAYKVTRHRKHKKNGNSIVILRDGEDISRSTAPDSNKLIEDIVGVSFDTFLYTTVLGPNSFRLSKLTDQGRKQILEEITGMTIYEQAKIAARDKAKQKKADLQMQEVRRDGSVSTFEVIKAARQDLLSQREAHKLNEEKQLDQYKESLKMAVAALDTATGELNACVEPPEVSQIQALEDMKSSLEDAYRASWKSYTEVRAKADHLLDLLKKASTVSGKTDCEWCGSDLNQDHCNQVIAERTEAYNSHLSEASNKEKEASKLQDQLWDLDRSIRSLTAIRDNYTNQRRSLSDLVERRKAEVSQWEAACKNHKAADSCVTDKLILQKDMELAQKTAEIEDLTSKLEEGKKLLEDIEYWVNGFQDLRVAAMDETLEFLNHQLSEYACSLFGDDVAVKLIHESGKISIKVSTMGGTYESASGGEKDRVDLCLAFALLDLARQCTSWGSNLLVMDEIAVHTDVKGVESLMDVVSKMSGSVGSVFMISHNPVFDGYGDRSLIVTRENGTSTAVLD